MKPSKVDVVSEDSKTIRGVEGTGHRPCGGNFSAEIEGRVQHFKKDKVTLLYINAQC